MAFDIIAAKRDGATDSEIADHLASKQGFKIELAEQDGATDSEILGHLLSKTSVGAKQSPPQPAPTSASRAIERTILPGAIASEYDVNAQSPTIGGPGLQGAVNVAQAPRIPRPLPTNQYADIPQAQMAGRQGPTRRALSALQESTEMVGPVRTLSPRRIFPVQASPTDTRVFGNDPNAATARQQLEPLAAVARPLNPAEMIGNAAEAFAAFAGDEDSQKRVLERVASAMQNLPISQAAAGSHPEGYPGRL